MGIWRSRDQMEGKGETPRGDDICITIILLIKETMTLSKNGPRTRVRHDFVSLKHRRGSEGGSTKLQTCLFYLIKLIQFDTISHEFSALNKETLMK